jgi:hypothetical protein
MYFKDIRGNYKKKVFFELMVKWDEDKIKGGAITKDN